MEDGEDKHDKPDSTRFLRVDSAPYHFNSFLEMVLCDTPNFFLIITFILFYLPWSCIYYVQLTSTCIFIQK